MEFQAYFDAQMNHVVSSAAVKFVARFAPLLQVQRLASKFAIVPVAGKRRGLGGAATVKCIVKS